MGELAKRFGERLKAARLTRGLTQAELADRAGRSDEWIRKIERGGASPSFAVIEQICAALGIAVGDLFEPSARTPALERLIHAAEGLTGEDIDWATGLLRRLNRRSEP